MPNRVLTKTNTTNSWQRLSKVINETGATTHVTYSLPECTASNLPATYPTNGMRCYPVLGPDPARPGYDMVEWWHKYVVTSITETDLQLENGAQSPPMVTSYEYEGSPAWHFADDNGLVRSNRKTWNQWRGYATVATRVGAGNVKTLTRTTFLRGMHGDRASMTGGTRTVIVNASLGSETVYDEDAFAGMTRETVTYNGSIDKPISRTSTCRGSPRRPHPAPSTGIRHRTIRRYRRQLHGHRTGRRRFTRLAHHPHPDHHRSRVRHDRLRAGRRRPRGQR